MKIPAFDDSLKNPRIIAVINAVLLIALLTMILFIAREITATVLQPKKSAGLPARGTPAAASRDLQDYAGLLNRNSFGIQGGELKALSSQSPASASPSEMILIGTIVREKDRSYAIFIDKRGQQNIFRTGDTLPGIGKLARVEKEKAYIRMDGREQEIPFSGITEVHEVKPPVASVPLGIGRKTGDSSYLIDQQKVIQALDRPDQIMTDARFTPHMVNGRQQGFILREVKPQGIYSSLGLQNGDVLLRINEFTISSAESALQALTALRGVDRAQLDIVRNGTNMTMTYQIR